MRLAPLRLGLGVQVWILLALWGGGSVVSLAQESEEPQPSDQQSVTAQAVETEVLELRDPFKRPIPVEAAVAAPLSELEAYAVDQFKMVGAITGTGRVRAILQDPQGKTHLVSEKMKIGPRKGIIREIRANIVKVREKVVNALGREEAVDTELRLIAEVKPD
ncbi:MAG: pilus assembly protein PilP [Oligoflexia bacterium]|jgi:Tfp pilus assembly protein PilP